MYCLVLLCYQHTYSNGIVVSTRSHHHHRQQHTQHRQLTQCWLVPWSVCTVGHYFLWLVQMTSVSSIAAGSTSIVLLACYSYLLDVHTNGCLPEVRYQHIQHYSMQQHIDLRPKVQRCSNTTQLKQHDSCSTNHCVELEVVQHSTVAVRVLLLPLSTSVALRSSILVPVGVALLELATTIASSISWTLRCSIPYSIAYLVW